MRDTELTMIASWLEFGKHTLERQRWPLLRVIGQYYWNSLPLPEKGMVVALPDKQMLACVTSARKDGLEWELDLEYE